MSADRVQVGTVVSILYDVTDLEGRAVDQARDRSSPFSYVHGARLVPAALEYALDGQPIGAVVSVTAPPPRRQARTSKWPGDQGLVFKDVEIIALRDATPDELRAHRLTFPFDLFRHVRMPAPVGDDLEAVRELSMFPPYPWGQWLYAQVFEALCKQLPGDVIELGVGLGGMSIFLAKLAARHGRRVLAFDSFEGLPPINVARDNPYFVEGDYGPKEGSADLLTRFEGEAARAGVGGSVVATKGYFEAALRALDPDQRFCFAHLDSDLHDSVRVSLEAVYDRVPAGGVIVLDDFFHHAMGPKRAASDFFNERKVYPVYHVSFPYSVFVIKGETWPRADRSRSIDGNWYSFDWLKRDRYFVETLRASAERSSKASDRAAANARALLELLDGGEYRSSDVYRYWQALEEFWDSADAFPERGAGRM